MTTSTERNSRRLNGFRRVWRIAWTRGRFGAALLAGLVVAGSWDALRDRFDAWRTRWSSSDPKIGAVSNDTEYFCPMDPGVVVDWPAKCPVCNMALVRRRRGESASLPEGVLARMQTTPDRMTLAGIKTEAVEYRELAREIDLVGVLAIDDRLRRAVAAPTDGTIERLTVDLWSIVDKDDEIASIIGEKESISLRAVSKGRIVEIKKRVGDHINKGEVVAIVDDPSRFLVVADVSESASELLARGAPVECRRESTSTTFEGAIRLVRPKASGGFEAVIESKGKLDGDWLPGQTILGRARVSIADLEPFRSRPSNPPSLRVGDLRALYSCPNHAEKLKEAPGRCSIDRKELERLALRDDQRVRWWCPMHPEVVAESAGKKCDACNGMRLVPRIVRFSPKGRVLALPAESVIDSGEQTFVYVERMPGMFDAVAVALGPRCGSSYPVIDGIEADQRVVAAGAFLIDAETRLNPSLAAGYFGASAGPSKTQQTPNNLSPNQSPDSRAHSHP